MTTLNLLFRQNSRTKGCFFLSVTVYIARIDVVDDDDVVMHLSNYNYFFYCYCISYVAIEHENTGHSYYFYGFQ